jgi:hypothetical protein
MRLCTVIKFTPLLLFLIPPPPFYKILVGFNILYSYMCIKYSSQIHPLTLSFCPPFPHCPLKQCPLHSSSLSFWKPLTLLGQRDYSACSIWSKDNIATIHSTLTHVRGRHQVPNQRLQSTMELLMFPFASSWRRSTEKSRNLPITQLVSGWASGVEWVTWAWTRHVRVLIPQAWVMPHSSCPLSFHSDPSANCGMSVKWTYDLAFSTCSSAFFFWWYLGLNSGPCSCSADTLLFAPRLQPFLLWLFLR